MIKSTLTIGLAFGFGLMHFTNPAAATPDHKIVACDDGYFVSAELYIDDNIACIGHGGALKKSKTTPKRATRLMKKVPASSVQKKMDDTKNAVIGKV